MIANLSTYKAHDVELVEYDGRIGSEVAMTTASGLLRQSHQKIHAI